MARGENSFALFFEEEAESLSDIAASVAKKNAELADLEAEKAAFEAAWANAIAEDEWRTRRAEWQLRRQNNYGKGYGQGRFVQNGRYNKNVNGRSSNGSVQGQSRPPSSSSERNNQVAQWKPIAGSDNGNAAESTAPSMDAANGASEEKTEVVEENEEKAEVVEESEEEKNARLKAEKEEIRKAKKEARENERRRKEDEARWKARQEEAVIEAKQITLKKYEEAVLSQKRKALEEKAKKLEGRKVTLDQEFETMHLIERKEEDELLVKLEPETEKSKNKLKKKSDKVQKVNITEFLKNYVPKSSKKEFNMSNGHGDGGSRKGRGSGAAPNRQETNSRNGQAFNNRNGANKGQTSRGSNRVNRSRNQTAMPPTPTPVKIVEEFPSLPKA